MSITHYLDGTGRVGFDYFFMFRTFEKFIQTNEGKMTTMCDSHDFISHNYRKDIPHTTLPLSICIGVGNSLAQGCLYLHMIMADIT